ncbi:MAG: ECF transporter S component [Mycoplasmatales bacterium]|nr:ECF transporter S component [Mycoplasmatales bacterium]
MQRGYTNNINFKIAFTGIMLGLVLLFQYLEKFMPIMNLFININLSIVFIITTLYITDWKWAMILLIIRFIMGPAVSGMGYSVIQIWSHFILFVMGFVYMGLFVLIHRFIFRKYKSNYGKLLIISFGLTIIVTSLIGAFLNAVFFFPIYIYIIEGSSGSLFDSAKAAYDSSKDFAFFGIPNYWLGMFAAFGVGNLIKYSVVSAIFVPLWKIVKRYEKVKE